MMCSYYVSSMAGLQKDIAVVSGAVEDHLPTLYVRCVCGVCVCVYVSQSLLSLIQSLKDSPVIQSASQSVSR